MRRSFVYCGGTLMSSFKASTNYSCLIKLFSAFADCIRLTYSPTAFAYCIRFAIPFTAYTTCILKAATLFLLHKTSESQRRPSFSALLRYTKQNDVRALAQSLSLSPCVSVSFSVCLYLSAITPCAIGLMTCTRSHSPHIQQPLGCTS